MRWTGLTSRFILNMLLFTGVNKYQALLASSPWWQQHTSVLLDRWKVSLTIFFSLISLLFKIQHSSLWTRSLLRTHFPRLHLHYRHPWRAWHQLKRHVVSLWGFHPNTNNCLKGLTLVIGQESMFFFKKNVLVHNQLYSVSFHNVTVSYFI